MSYPPPTSIDTYLSEVLPKLGEKQQVAYRYVLGYLQTNPGMSDITGTEVNRHSGMDLHKRLSELREQGLLENSVNRVSTAVRSSNKAVQTWRPTWSTTVMPLAHSPPIAIQTHKEKLITILREITKDWCCCCRPGYEKCAFCQVENAIENK